MLNYALKIESAERTIEITEKGMILSANVYFDTSNNKTQTKSNNILAQMIIKGYIEKGNEESINKKLIKVSEWARDLKQATTYRKVTLEIKKDDDTLVRTYDIPSMFVCDYKEFFDSENDTYKFELILNQSDNKLGEIKIY